MESNQATPPRSRRLLPGTETEAPSGQVQRHSKFWFEDGNVTLQVEETQFKLHRSLLSLSCGTFHDMFAVGGDATSEATDENPLLLPGRPLEGFVLLCRAIYANWGDTQKLSVDELVELLGTAHFYNAHDIYARTVAELGRMPLSLIERIVYGERFAIDDWVASAFVGLVQSLRPLSEKDADAIGLRMAWKVASAQKTIVHKRLTRVLLAPNGNGAGCCNICHGNYIRPAHGQLTLLICGEPINTSQDVEGYIGHLRAEMKTRCPNVGSCGNQNCQTWPTAEHVRKWLDIATEEHFLRQMLSPLNV